MTDDYANAVSILYNYLLPTLRPGETPAELRVACLLHVAEIR